MSLNTSNAAMDIHTCMAIQEIQEAILNNIDLQDLKTYEIEDWPSSGVDVKQGIQHTGHLEMNTEQLMEWVLKVDKV